MEGKNNKHEVAILGLSIRDRQRSDGCFELAFFDASVNGVSLVGCLLLLTKAGGCTVRAPLVPNDRAKWSAVQIVEPSLQHAVMVAARTAYVALGGTMVTKPESPLSSADEQVVNSAEAVKVDRMGLNKFLRESA